MKTRGFTLVEMVVALTLASIAVALFFTIFTAVIKTYRHTEHSSEWTSDIQFLHSSLQTNLYEVFTPSFDDPSTLHGTSTSLDFDVLQNDRRGTTHKHVSLAIRDNTVTYMLTAANQPELVLLRKTLQNFRDARLLYFDPQTQTWLPSWNTQVSKTLPSLIRFTCRNPKTQESFHAIFETVFSES